MVTNKYLTRQSDLIPESILSTPITVVGAGAIGSFTVLTLAKMGFNNITVFDDDEIDFVNINNQFYRISDIGKKKVDALYDLVSDFTGIAIKPKAERANGFFMDKIVISAVDSMDSRKQVYNMFGGALLVDPRMAIEYASIRTYMPLAGDKPTDYTNSLFNDNEAAPERCTAKATMYTASMIAGHVSKIVLDFCLDRDIIRSLDWDIGENKYSTYVEKKGN
jgi:molybdopterin/thiamine biosynthesis adenylyltransferase